MSDSESTEGKTPSRNGEYARIAVLSAPAVKRLSELLQSKNEMVALGATNTILNKVIPNLKSVEINGGLNDDGSRREIRVYINAGGGFLPSTITLPTSSAGGLTKPSPKVQSTDMAPEGEENIHGDNGVGEASTS